MQVAFLFVVLLEMIKFNTIVKPKLSRLTKKSCVDIQN